MKVLPIGLHRDLARALAQANLLHRERENSPGAFLAADGLAVLLSCVDNWILRRACHQSFREQSRTSGGSDGRQEIPARKMSRLDHLFVLHAHTSLSRARCIFYTL